MEWPFNEVMTRNMDADEIARYLYIYGDTESPLFIAFANADSQIDAFASDCDRLEESLFDAESRAEDAEARAETAETHIDELKARRNKLLNLLSQKHSLDAEIKFAADDLGGLEA